MEFHICMLMLHNFICQKPVATLKRIEMKNLACETTMLTYNNWFREILSLDMVLHPIRLGGPGHIVHLDESYFACKRKYNRGRMAGAREDRHAKWVFGCIDVDTQQSACWFVPNRSAAILMEKIEDFILPGTTIHTDEWAAYNGIGTSRNGYIHRTVCHKRNFVDPLTGVHTQNIEGYWCHAKKPMKAAHGVAQAQKSLYLDEFQWRWNHKGMDMLAEMERIIGEQYDVSFDHLPLAVLAAQPDIQYH